MQPETNELEYFVGIGVPTEYEERLSVLKQQFHPRGKLSSPPHITLIPPFMHTNQRYVIEKLTAWARRQRPFSMRLDKIGSFKHRTATTLYLAPDKTEDIQRLYRSLITTMRFATTSSETFTPGKSFTPHLTLAQRVPLDAAPLIKQQLRAHKLDITWEVKGIMLYCHRGRQPWAVFRELSFESFGREVREG